jgi:sulfatase modifying factor 1
MGSASPYGTFDQGGNVFEWNEAIINGSNRGVRGGDVFHNASRLVASDRGSAPPDGEFSNVGFRVVPEPAAKDLFVVLGMLGIGYLEKRRLDIRTESS